MIVQSENYFFGKIWGNFNKIQRDKLHFGLVRNHTPQNYTQEN